MRILSSSAFAFTLAFSASVFAQGLELPQPSPKARVEQRVGLTDFAVDYSSPGVKKRPIWGTLVPYDKPWRTGANSATTIKASKDFTFGDKKVPAGTYGLYTIPSKGAWTVALSSQTDAPGGAFDPAKDVARISVKATPIKMRERLTFTFAATSDDATRLELEWEKVRISIPIAVDTKAQALANIDKAVDDAWRPHFNAARYLLESGGDVDKAMSYADASIGVKPTWWNTWVKAQLLAKKGNVPEAIAAGEKAQTLGQGDRVFEGFFKADVAKAVGGWKAKK
jgi:hypothetical protein